MNGSSQMQGGKNWILPKEINANYGTEWRERVAMDSGSQVTFKMQNWLYRCIQIIENRCSRFSIDEFYGYSGGSFFLLFN